mgnify:CR=1 FL=1
MRTYLTSEFTPRDSYDVCIVGAGAAGIVLADKLRRSGLSVFLAEGGGEDFSDESQVLYQGTTTGTEYYDLEVARLRYFGGTTNHWGGMCRPLEAQDFEPKAAAPNSGWPISREDLAVHFEEAAGILEIPTPPDDTVLNSESTLRRVHFVFSPPVRFAEKFGAPFAADADLHLCLNCNLVDADFEGKVIRRLIFRNFTGHQTSIAAKYFVIACGGIENSRLLLHLNRKFANALGHQSGNVGRYWMEHPTHTIGDFLICGDLSFADDDSYPPFSRDRLYIAPTAKFIEDQQIMNCRLRFDRAHHGILGELFSAGYCSLPDEVAQNLSEMAAGNLSMGWIRASWEQEPLWSNHIALSQETDAFGIPRVVLNWERSELVKRTMRTVALETAAYFARQNTGRVRLHDWVLSEEPVFSCEGGGHCPGGYHHMGGTRMAEAPAGGVTDLNCRVFGTENLFVAGSSLFPSTGYCNPTTTIVQLALRLGEHLAKAMA